MARYFGTDGIRDRADGPLLATSFLYRVGYALGQLLVDNQTKHLPVIAIGRDPRPSGPRILDDLRKGLSEHHVAAYDLGICPTPAVSVAIQRLHADLGIVITASHNPAHDNGIKLFAANGEKVKPELEDRIEGLIDQAPAAKAADPQPGMPFFEFDAQANYVHWLRSKFSQDCFQEKSVVIDTANGATREAAPRIFKHLGLDVHQLGADEDGGCINDRCGSENTEQLARAVRKRSAELGVAFDGDGDRLVVVDRQGERLAGELLLAILARDLKRRGKLARNRLVTTIHSNLGLDHALAQDGIEVLRSPVGDRAVALKMREAGATFGGESSGHLIFSEYLPTGDGLLCALQVLALLQRHPGKGFAELAEGIRMFPQATAKVEVSAKPPLENLAGLLAARRATEQELGASGRILVRYSGTEPILRILVEAETNQAADRACEHLRQAASLDLGAGV